MDASCRQAIFDNHDWMQAWTDRASTPPHVFGNICEQVPSGSYDENAKFATRKRQVDSAFLQRSQFCFTHNQMCPNLMPVDVDMSGLPCQDMSKANHNRKFFEGNHGDAYLVWSKKHRRLRTPLLILENTPATQPH